MDFSLLLQQGKGIPRAVAWGCETDTSASARASATLVNVAKGLTGGIFSVPLSLQDARSDSVNVPSHQPHDVDDTLQARPCLVSVGRHRSQH